MTSFDGTPISTHFFGADGLGPGGRAPLVMVAHGYGESGPATRSTVLYGAPSIDALLTAGYNVLTWDARGHGASGGSADFDNPDVEGRDTQMLIDWAATQPEVQLDAPGDPRVGMAGASYGGLIQLITAGLDSRIDVIEPAYTGYSLSDTTLAPFGKAKEAWAALLGAAGAQAVPPGVVSAAGPQVHSPSPGAVNALLSMAATGELTGDARAFADYRSPSRFVGDIRIPTLLQQGTTDTLFPLVNAFENFAVLKGNGVPVKIVWNCEGHSICGRSAGPPGHYTAIAINWFDRWLRRDLAIDTGPPFEWLADNEAEYRSAGSFPPRASNTLEATGSGSLLLSPGSPGGSPGVPELGGSPSNDAVNIDLPAPSGPGDVVGYPDLELTYSGTATPARTWVYAQIVDIGLGRVVGGQVTPIPVTLDGAAHTLRESLNAIATRAGTGSRYRLQIFGGSLIFGAQRSTGTIALQSAHVSLPIIDPSAHQRLLIGRPVRLLPAGAGRPVRVPLEARLEGYRDVRLRLERLTGANERVIGSSRRRDIGVGTARIGVRVARRLRTGRYRVVATGSDSYGKRISVRRGVRLKRRQRAHRRP